MDVALGELGLKGIIDAHVHPLPMLDEGELLKEIRSARVMKCALLALDLDPGELEGEGARRFLEEMFNAGVWAIGALEQAREILKLGRTPNEHVAELVRRYPDLFIGFGSVNPSKPMGYVEEKLTEIEELGLRGLKLIPTLQFFCPNKARKALNRILRFCQRSGMTVVFHTGCDPGPWEAPSLSRCANPALLRPFVRSFLDVKFVLAHAGSYSARSPGIWFEEALELASSFRNVWLDVAAVPYLLTEPNFARALRSRKVMDKVLFGSDYPVTGSSILEVASLVLSSSELSPEEKVGIMTLNAEALLGS